MKRASKLTLPRKVRTQQAALLHKHLCAVESSAAKKIQPLSLLENLPVELLQHIFFYCLELNLPKASRHLARTLSTRSIYSALILLAYFDDDGESPLEKHHFLPAEYRQISIHDRVRLQEAILRCRWCTLDVVRSCMPALSRLQMVQAWHRERRLEEELGEAPKRRMAPSGPHTCCDVVMSGGLLNITTFPHRSTPLPALDDRISLERYFFAKADPVSDQYAQGTSDRDEHVPHIAEGSPPRGSAATATTSPPVDSNNENYLPRIISRHTACDQIVADQGFSVLAGRTFPEHLLRGAPWTEEKLKLLQLLRQGARFLTSGVTVTLSPDAMYSGMGAAMREGNEAALLVLLELFSSVQGGGSNLSLPAWLFHLAVADDRPATPTTRLLSLLLRADLASVPRDDAALTRWAAHAASSSSSSSSSSRASSSSSSSSSQEGRALAQFLLSHMEMHDDGFATTAAAVAAGSQGQTTTTTRRRRQGAYELSTVPFAQEIGYMCAGAVFKELTLMREQEPEQEQE